jgi:hypothetical protein
MRLISAAKLLVLLALSLILFGVLAGFFPVPVNQASYRANIEEVDSLRASQGYVVVNESGKSTPSEPASAKPQFGDVIRSIEWRPWVAIISTLFVLCIWRKVNLETIVSTIVFSALLLIPGLQMAAAYSLVAVAIYAASWTVLKRKSRAAN